MTNLARQATELIAFVDGEAAVGLVAEIRDAVGGAARDRAWSLTPPELVDAPDEGTVGCVLRLRATHDARGIPLAVELDEASLNDTKALVSLLAPISGRWAVDIGFKLGGESVGWLEAGRPDPLLSHGLIGA